MSDRPCMLSPEKWRVSGRYRRSVSTTVPRARGFYAWGVWPPGWDIEADPLLWFPLHRQAFRAAFDRSQFASSPPPRQFNQEVNRVEAP